MKTKQDLVTEEEQKKEAAEEKAKTLENIGLAGAAAEVVGRYGSAAKEHLVAYSGVDNEAGKTLHKGLKSISESKVNSEYKKTNIKQQAGYSAEVKETARENADRIINGDKKRVTRTDDLGRVNDPLYDHVVLDENGMVISGSGSQMKFVGGTPREALDKLASHKFEKYLDADVKIEVPSDFYDGIKQEAQEKIRTLENQVKELRAQGKNDIAAQKLREIEKYKKIHRNLKKSHVSNKEAVEARLYPELSTAKDILKISHRAGMEQAKTGAVIAGGLSLVRNFVSVVKGDKEPDEAALELIKDTGTGAVASYATAFAGSALKGSMQNAGNTTIRSLAKTSLPGQIVMITLETSKTLVKYFSGEIDGVQCLEELGEKGTGMVSSALFATLGVKAASSIFGTSAIFTIGTVSITPAIIGGLVGSILGYSLCCACYGIIMSALALKDIKLAREERIRIEAECAEAIRMIREYRAEMEKLISQYLSDHIHTFHIAFDDMKNALQIGDIDGFIGGANAITKKLGGKPQFNTFSEFDSLMRGPEELIL
jgi:hypothetical protein